MAYSDPVFDANRKRLGRAMFVNTFQEGSNVLVPGRSACATARSPSPGTKRNGEADIAVTGGTGAYAGARGTYVESNNAIELRGEDGPGRYRRRSRSCLKRVFCEPRSEAPTDRVTAERDIGVAERAGGQGTGDSTGPGRRCAQARRDPLRRYAISGMMRIATMFATLIIGLIAGPEVSL